MGANWLTTAVAAIVVACGARPSMAQCKWLPGDGYRGTDDALYATTAWDPDGPGPMPEVLAVGGRLRMAGRIDAELIATWDGQRWAALGPGLTGPLPGSADDAVFALAIWRGRLCAAVGHLVLPSATYTSSIAVWNGSSWDRIAENLTGVVGALAEFDGGLVAGGEFTTIGGLAANRVA